MLLDTGGSGRTGGFIRTPGPGVGWAGGLPVKGTIGQGYGVKNSDYSAGYHTGLDISAPAGTPVYTPLDGVVISAGYSGAYGNAVYVRHKDGTVGLYGHMQFVSVRQGQRVRAGTKLGGVGTTGNSTANHLHWEIRKPGNVYGAQYDPQKYIDGYYKGRGGGGEVRQPRNNSPLTLAEMKWYARRAGFNEREASIMAAIGFYESGGRPGAHNGDAGTGDNSYGLWQINMLGGMGPDRRAALGIRNNNALFDPATNARAAYMIYKQQGLHAWSVYTNGSYRGKLNQATQVSAQRPTGGGGGGGMGLEDAMSYFFPEQEAASPRELAEGASFSVAFFKSDPELWKIFQSAIDRGDTDSRGLLADIRNSKWWRTHSESQRAAQAMKTSDPQTYRLRMRNTKAQVKNLAGELGIDLKKNQLNKVAQMVFVMGWGDEQVRDYMINTSRLSAQLRKGKEVGGQAGELQDAFNRVAAAYGLNPSDNMVAKQVLKVMRGNGTQQDMMSWAQNRAKQLYPHLSDDIDRGLSVEDVAAPFRDAAARLLEESPDAINLRDSLISRALKGDGKATMNLADFEEMVRRSPGWQTTDQANEAYMGFGREVLSDFGFMGRG